LKLILNIFQWRNWCSPTYSGDIKTKQIFGIRKRK